MINNIAFPKLGIEMSVNRVAFTFFGKDIYWYGIIIGLGFLLGVCYGLYRAKKFGFSYDNILDLVIWGLPVSIICARAFYALGDKDLWDEGLYKMIAIWDGGIAIFGAIIGAAIVGLTYSKIKKLDTALLFDVCAPSIMIGQIVGRWGNFVNAEVYGIATDFVFGMSINGSECVMPLFLYESAWMLLGLVLLSIYERYKRVNGEIFLLYIIWYGVGRVVLESFREEGYVLKIMGMPLSQITAVLAVVLAVVLLVYLYLKKKKSPVKSEDDNIAEPSDGKAAENEQV